MEWLANLSIKWVLVGVAALVIALAAARNMGDDSGRGNDWLVENLQVVLSVVVVVFLIIRPFLFQAFYIPSDSMVPTLLGPKNPGESAGDRLLVNKLIYRVSDPKRGDIVVFHAPPEVSGSMDLNDPRAPANEKEGKEFIKRVMGVPGETISVAPPRLTIDDRQAVSFAGGGAFNTPSYSGLSISSDDGPKIASDGKSADVETYGDPVRILASPDFNLKHTRYRVELNGKVLLDSPDGRIQELTDLARFGVSSKVQARAFVVQTDQADLEDPQLIVIKGSALAYRKGEVVINGKPIPDYTPRYPEYVMDPVKLGPDEYFMMGDNRNNSNDSHQWGPLKRSRVIGRAEIIFWPLNRAKMLEWWLLIALVLLFGAYEIASRMFRGRPSPPQAVREGHPSPSRP